MLPFRISNTVNPLFGQIEINQFNIVYIYIYNLLFCQNIYFVNKIYSFKYRRLYIKPY